MLVKWPLCMVKDVNVSNDGEAQYLTLIEPGGGEYQLTARPNDPEYPCDAVARLRPFLEQFQPCEIEADVVGRISTWQGQRKQLLTLRKLAVKPAPVKPDLPASK